MLSHVPEFLLVSGLVIVTPGQDTVLTVRNTLVGGRRAGSATALGVVCGQALWVLATGTGLVAILQSSEIAFRIVQLAGAVYLVFLGAQSLVRAFRPGAARPAVAPAAASPGITPTGAFRQGLVSNLGNPKMAVFFTSLLPQFAPRGPGAFPAVLVLGLAFCSLTLVWLAAYAVVVARAGHALRQGPLRRAFDVATGAVLVLLGFRVLTQRA